MNTIKMKKIEAITIQKRELPELKKWIKKKNKNILKIIDLGKGGIKVMVQDN